MISGALGLTLGCLVRPDQIGLMFGPLMNPLVYLSEGVRAALTPTLPHMATVAYLGASIAIAVFLVVFGPNRFVRRVMI